MKENKNLSGMVRHAGKMMAGTLASRVLGLAREMLTAAFFGATRQLDAFYIAYTLANLSRQLLAEGALSAAFVPIFSRTLSTDGKDEARSLARQAFSVLLTVTLSVVVLGIFMAPFLVRFLAPGFSSEDYALAVSLTKTIFPFLLLMSLSALAMGVLNSMGSFFIPAIAPAVSNFAYILLLVVTMRHKSVWNLAFAVLLGGICQMVLQYFWCGKMDMTLVPAKPRKDNARLREMMKLFIPYAAGLSLNQINPVISRMMGSFLEGGSISVLNYADRVLQLPLGLFVIAISQAILPMLSRLDPYDASGFRDFIRDALRFNLFIVLPTAAGLFTVSSQVVHILFFRGAFTEWAWHATAVALALYGLGLPGMASSTLILRAMYARKMPRAAMTVTGCTVAVNLIASLTLMPMFKYAGLATSLALAFTCSSIYGMWALSRNLKLSLGIFDVKWCSKILVSVFAMIAVLLLFKLLLPYPADSRIIYRAIWFAAATVLSAATYGGCTLALRCSEWQWLKDAFRNRKNKGREAK